MGERKREGGGAPEDEPDASAFSASRLEQGDHAGAEPVRRPSILVVDDDAAICRMMQRLLSPEFEVMTTTNAWDALRMIASGHHLFEVILCDMTMPDMNGRRFLDSVELLDPDQASRVVLMSGRAHDLEPLPKSGHVVEKPFEREALRGAVRAVVREHARPVQTRAR